MKTMKRLIVVWIFLGGAFSAYGWGQTGHRVVGQIAYNHLTKKAKKKLELALQGESLAMVGTYMDEIRSDPKYRYLNPWHYCTIPDGMTYEEAGTPEEGDAIAAIRKFYEELKSGTLTAEEEKFVLKCLVHLVADIHQPLHVGNGNDKGGNDFKVKYFRKSTNLHTVWDSGMIDGQNLSYTEYAAWVDRASKEQIARWQKDDLMVWVEESMSYRSSIYDVPESKSLSYPYSYKNLPIVNKRLLQAGIRLAGLLNELYG